MPEPILLRLPPGALRVDEPASLPVTWHLPGDSIGQGSLSDFLQAHPGASVGLLFSIADFLLTRVTLNRKQARHLHKVVPYLLEEQLIGDPEGLWFSAGAVENGHYPVLVGDRAGLERVKRYCEDGGLVVVGAAVDAELLRADAPVIAEGDSLLVVADTFQAVAVPAAQRDVLLPLLQIDLANFSTLDTSALWPHWRQAWRKRIELLHSSLKPKSAKKQSTGRLPPGWRQFAIAATVLLTLAWSLAWLQAWQYGRLASQTLAEAGQRYERLFPGDRATATLGRQFRTRLEQSGGGSVGGSAFLRLMTPVAQSLASMQSTGVAPKRILFEERDATLMLDLEAKSYEGLEAVRAALIEAGLQAEIANFRNQGEQVAARMKVNAS